MNNKNDFYAALVPVRIPQRYLRCTLTGKRGIRLALASIPACSLQAPALASARIRRAHPRPCSALAPVRIP